MAVANFVAIVATMAFAVRGGGASVEQAVRPRASATARTHRLARPDREASGVH